MSRLYYPKIAQAELAGGEGGGVDVGEAAKKIGKLIPTELITAYAALVSASMMIHWQGLRQPVFWVCFAICWVLTPIYLNMVADAGRPRRNQIIVGTLAFPIWAYLVSGAQVIPAYYDAGLATVITLVFSVATTPIPMNR